MAWQPDHPRVEREVLAAALRAGSGAVPQVVCLSSPAFNSLVEDAIDRITSLFARVSRYQLLIRMSTTRTEYVPFATLKEYWPLALVVVAPMKLPAAS